ncbi:MAG: GNAT family N-acetyltransferase [Paludibacteraceae bacterium]|nr:GNAT family N-acetyltransferase [Paludibacteraceae bacterium]
MTDNKDTYRDLCALHSEIPLFLQSWWMDAACGNEWNVLISRTKSGDVGGVLVFHYKKRFGFFAVLPAVLTPYSGTWLFYPDNVKLEERYSFENYVMNDLIGQLAKLDAGLYVQNFHYSQTNWQPFYWCGYKQTSRYTFRIEDISNLDYVYSQMSHRKRQKPLAKAEDGYAVSFDLPADVFYDMYALELKGRGSKIMYSKEYFLKLHKAAADRGQGQIISLYHGDTIHAALWILWDRMSAYNMVIVIPPEFRSSGASTRIVWEALRFLQGKSESYDFEGSMIKGVALKNQSFGAVQIPYSSIIKINNPILKLWHKIKNS